MQMEYRYGVVGRKGRWETWHVQEEEERRGDNSELMH